jgi:CheY-like chemotaxis protein
VESLALLDTPPEPEFDAIAEEAARLTGYDTALVTLMDADRCWFKAKAGVLAAPGIPREIPRGLTYCQHALGSSGFFTISDGLADPRVSDLPSVNGPGGFRAYAGLQLIMPEGLSVGSICVMNRSPRTATPGDAATLRRLADRTLQLIAARRPRAPVAAPRRNTVLVVDDDCGIRMLLGEVFERLGVPALIAGGGGEALRLYRENESRIAVVLTDFNMPGVNGLALVRTLGRESNPPAFVVMSAHLGATARVELEAAGVRTILRKPFAVSELDVVTDLVRAAGRPRRTTG